MKIKVLIVAMLGIFVVGITLSFMMINNKNIAGVDIVAINDGVKIAEKNWGKINEETFRNTEINQPFAVIDDMETLIYQTEGYHFNNLYEAIKNRDTIIDLKQNNAVVGKLMIQNNEQNLIEQMKSEIITVLCLIFSFQLFISILSITFIYKTMIKPFQQLQLFATNVARGNLEMPLNMKKSNYFGAFTESFDLLREELDAARQREYESNRSKKELVATLSHDIKTPIASIKAVSELMQMQAKDEKVLKQVNTIYQKAEQVDLLVTDMFHATLEELQQLTVTVSEQSSEILVQMIEDVNYDQQIKYDAIPPCILLMDPVRMQQVLDNVISNSYKYARTKIIIHAQINHGFLELQINDFGSGIHEEEIPLLFNKYYRGKNVQGKGGSGLGLYISKYFMEHMDGHIHCYNRQDGFTVLVKIKLA